MLINNRHFIGESEAKEEKRKTRLQPNSAMGSIVRGKLQHHQKKLKKTIVIETLVLLLHV